MRLSGDQLAFMARFSKSPEGQTLLTIYEAKLKEREAMLRTAVGEEVHRQQGRALELDEMIADIAEAQQRLNRSLSTVTSPSRRAA